MVYLYFISVVVYFYLIFRYRLPILSPFVIFGLFSFIYSFFPWLYLTSEVEVFLFSADCLNMQSANKILLLQSLSNFALCLMIPLPVSRNITSILENKESLIKLNVKNVYWYIYPISLILVWYFPWGGDVVESSAGYSLAAAAKNLLLVAFCVYCNKSSSVKQFFAFAAFLFLCVIDTSRTTMFILLFLYAYYSVLSWKKLFKYIYFLVPIFFLFVWITLNRNNIDFEFKYILWVFYTESLLGGYSTFQSIAIVDNSLAHFYQFLYPIADIFIYLIPSFFFNIFDLVKSDTFLLPSYFKSLFESGFLSEEYAPIGGHFYLAEFFLYFKYLTPLFVFLYFYLFFIIIEKIRYKEIALILYCSSFLLVKTSIFNNFKTYLSIIIIAYTLMLFFKMIKILIKPSR